MLCNAGKGSSELSKALVPLDAEYLQLLVWSLGKGTPPELRTLYRLMQKGLGVPKVPLAWEGPRCQTTWRSQDQIPGAGLFPWQQGLTGAESQRKQCTPAQAQPVNPSQVRQAAQLSRVRVEKESANTSQVGRREEHLHHKV